MINDTNEEDLNNSTFLYKKINFTPSSKMGVIFSSSSEKKEVYFTSGGKIIGYNFENGLIFDKISFHNNTDKLFPSKIKKLKQIGNFFYFLDNNNCFFEYDPKTKLITSSIKLSDIESRNFTNFTFSGYFYSFYFIDNDYNITQVKLDDKSEFDNNSTHRFKIIKNNFTPYKIDVVVKNKNKNIPSPIFDINEDGNVLIYSIKNKLILQNLTNDTKREIEFQKFLSCGLFLSNEGVAVGDYGGKIHILSKLNEKNVFKLFNI
jgi:hypothetical protein